MVCYFQLFAQGLAFVTPGQIGNTPWRPPLHWRQTMQLLAAVLRRTCCSKSSSPKEYVKNASIVVPGIWLRVSHVVRPYKLVDDSEWVRLGCNDLVRTCCTVGEALRRDQRGLAACCWSWWAGTRLDGEMTALEPIAELHMLQGQDIVSDRQLGMLEEKKVI